MKLNCLGKDQRFGVDLSGNEYDIKRLAYKVTDISDTVISVINGVPVNGYTKDNEYVYYYNTFTGETIYDINFYTYQIIKISYDNFSFDNVNTTTYKIVPRFTSGNILDGETSPPTLTYYLAGGCFSSPITNSITYSPTTTNYDVTQNFPSSLASMNSGKFQPLSTGVSVEFNKDQIKLIYDASATITTCNVKSDGTFNQTSKISWIDPSNVEHVGEQQQSVYTTSFSNSNYSGYTIPAANAKNYTKEILGNFKYSFTSSTNINQTSIKQNGVNTKKVDSKRYKSVSAISDVSPTKPYVVFHAIIPYSFINMYNLFYSAPSNAKFGTLDININGLNNNGIILYIPATSLFFANIYEQFRTDNKKNYDGDIIRRINIDFSGKGYVVVATTSKNRDVISDNNIYQDNEGAYLDTFYRKQDWTFYVNGNRSGKYIKKFYVDNDRITIMMKDFQYHSATDNGDDYAWKGPRFFIRNN